MTYLVSFAQSFIHYHSIAMKLGTNLSKEEESGRFIFIDCLTHLMDDSDTSKSSTDSAAASSNSRITFSLNRLISPLFAGYVHDVVHVCCLLSPYSELSLRGLYQQVSHSIERALSQLDRPVCLVIDDLSVLLSLGVKLSEVVSFISYCRRMLTSPNGLCSVRCQQLCPFSVCYYTLLCTSCMQGTGYLVAMVHCDVCDSDEEEQLLRRHLLHVCHLSLHVEGLVTGYSKDVHGNVSGDATLPLKNCTISLVWWAWESYRQQLMYAVYIDCL